MMIRTRQFLGEYAKILLLLSIFAICIIACFFTKKKRRIDYINKIVENLTGNDEEKGYNLSIDEDTLLEVKEDCGRSMELISDLYLHAQKGDALNVVISDDIILKMQDRIKQENKPVISKKVYSNMDNYEIVEKYLNDCKEGKEGSTIIYEVHCDGGLGRYQFDFDGSNMYVLSANAVWDKENNPTITYISYDRIKKWKYTDKGFFCYEKCVPEYPKVPEIVDGSCLIRIKPITDEKREMSEKYVFYLGYQGNNLLCSNWDYQHMEILDYNGMYEYLYMLKYHKRFNSDEYQNGIPKNEFESLIMEYLPVTAEQIRQYAVFNEENQIYVWSALCCMNFSPSYFATSVPEVTDIRQNGDGTVTLTVDAVCESVLCNDALITHELTIECKEDGSFQYLENRVLNDGINTIPRYQYRVKRE